MVLRPTDTREEKVTAQKCITINNDVVAMRVDGSNYLSLDPASVQQTAALPSRKRILREN